MKFSRKSKRLFIVPKATTSTARTKNRFLAKEDKFSEWSFLMLNRSVLVS